jgi:hypothetical protein
MRKITIGLIGILIGQLLMGPALFKLYLTPMIETELVDVRDDYFTATKSLDYKIKNVPSVFFDGRRDLHVHIRTQDGVKEAYREIYDEEVDGLLGFYHPETNEIWSVNSTIVLSHEYRHIFEGYFHRNALEDNGCGFYDKSVN